MDKHTMITRSKHIPPPDDEDENGNLKGLIDYDCNTPFDRSELDDVLLLLSRGSSTTLNCKEHIKTNKKRNKIKITEEIINDTDVKHPKQKNKIVVEEITETKSNRKGKVRRSPDISDMLVTYILTKANETLKKPKRKKRNKMVINDIYENTDSEILPIDEEELTDKSTTDDEIEMILEDDDGDDDGDDDDGDDDDTVLYSLKDIDLEDTSGSEEEGCESEDESEYDELDNAYSELVVDNAIDNTEDGNLNYFHTLDEPTKKRFLTDIRTVYEENVSNIPLKFKVLDSDMDKYTKSIALNNLDKLAEMDISTGEYNKMDQWINGLIKLPFGKVTPLPVTNTDSFDKTRTYIQDTLENMNKAIYGHVEAKTHILQVIGKWIKNPESLGNVLAIQGPMGNGKTTLIKDGIAKSLNRPFEFVALGGASDSSFFEGHSYTYEGSRWGRIVDILHKCGSMNPIICFDELDKVSETSKGDEIINMLIHMTDSSQNAKFQDNYYPGIDIDLSKVLFIFSFNDESKINRILKDRMHVIRTKGYDIKDKLQIAHNYLIPDILDTFGYTKEEISFSDEILTEIVQKYTEGEEGVRNLKRCLENIVSTLNIYHLTKCDGKDDFIDVKIKDFKIPIILTIEHINALLKVSSGDNPPEHMYM
jgi:hypothetical protein